MASQLSDTDFSSQDHIQGHAWALAAALAQALDAELAVGPDVLRYVLAVAGRADAQTLRELLDPANPERQALTALLLEPGQELPGRLEPLLEPLDAFDTASTVPAVVDALVKLRPCPRLRLADDPAGLPLDLEAGDLFDMVARLHLGQGQDPAVRQAVLQALSGDAGWQVLAALRRERHARGGVASEFLARAVTRLRVSGPELFALLGFACRMLAAAPQADPARLLAERHAQASACLAQAGRLRTRLEQGNVEMLLLSGARLANMDEDALRAELDMLRTLGLAVYGVPPGFGGPRDVDLGQVAGADEALVSQLFGQLAG